MKARNAGIEIIWLDENRYAVTIDGIVCYVGSLEECERRAAILMPRNDHPIKDDELAALAQLPRGKSARTLVGSREISPACPPAPVCRWWHSAVVRSPGAHNRRVVHGHARGVALPCGRGS